MITIKSLFSHRPIETKEVLFGGGERHVQILSEFPAAEITLKYANDYELISLLMYVDALRRSGCDCIMLNIPYFPGARQDRVCNKGEALSVKVYADLINSMGFEQVKIFDAHSDVTAALLNNVQSIKNHDFVSDVMATITEDCPIKNLDKYVLISPDAGSNKKIYDVAKHMGGKYQVVRCDKLRDVSNGKIIETLVYADDLTGKTAIIIDDVISYGGTFCSLAIKLREIGASDVILVVSHTEGVASLSKLKESGISAVYTTNSKEFDMNDYNKSNYIKTFDINKYLQTETYENPNQ
jgi:ribose-phosphate pyrophosphokinase